MHDDLDRAIVALREGEAVVLPTDTVYGVAALPSIAGATTALQRLKDRSADQALAVLVADREQALALAGSPSLGILRLMDRFWPGPLTLVLRRSADAAGLELGGDPATIGVRWPDHQLVHQIAAAVGPIATTSANRHGEATPARAVEAAASLLGPVAVVLDGGVLDNPASTVVDVTGDRPRVLRAGAISADAVTLAFDGPGPAGTD